VPASSADPGEFPAIYIAKQFEFVVKLGLRSAYGSLKGVPKVVAADVVFCANPYVTELVGKLITINCRSSIVVVAPFVFEKNWPITLWDPAASGPTYAIVAESALLVVYGDCHCWVAMSVPSMLTVTPLPVSGSAEPYLFPALYRIRDTEL
jgi:hypothetical protein